LSLNRYPKICRFQGRNDEFHDPGLNGSARAGHIQNLDAIRPDEGSKFLPRRLETGM
jgi:hypothetical protein